MATPQMPEDHAAAIEALKTALPATRQEIFAAVPWYAETNSRKAALSKDLRAIGASAPERGGVWAIGGAKANRARRVEKRAVTSETSGLPDVRSLPSEYLAECMREVNRRLREVEVLRSVLEAA